MKTTFGTIWAALAMLGVVLGTNIHAAPFGSAFTYQGKLYEAGQPANGTFEFEFVAYDAPTNGNPVSAPVTREEVPVTQGLFTVELDFGAGVFNGDARWLQITVKSDATGTAGVLWPRTQVTPTPYALMAADVKDGAISNNKLADGAVNGAKIAGGSITGTQLANGSVGPAQLANSSVGTAHLVNGSVGTPQLANGSVGSAQLANGAVDTPQLADASVTSPKLALGAVDSQQLQFGSVTANHLAAGVLSPTNLPAGSITVTQLAKPPLSGLLSSDALDDDFLPFHFDVTFNPTLRSKPVIVANVESDVPGFADSARISFLAKSTNGFSIAIVTTNTYPLRYVDGVTNIAYNHFAGDVASPAVIGGHPAGAGSFRDLNDMILFGWDHRELRFWRATNATGMGKWRAISVVTNFSPESVVLMTVNARPAIACFGTPGNSDFSRLQFFRAGNNEGTNWLNPVHLDVTTTNGGYISAAIAGGSPAISFFDQGRGRLKYIRALNVDGTSWGGAITVATNVNIAPDTSLAIVNGNPAITYYDRISQNYCFVRALDANGNTWGAPVTVANSSLPPGEYTKAALVVADGRPAIAYADYEGTWIPALKFQRALDANGGSWGPAINLGTNGVSRRVSMAIVQGRPAILTSDRQQGGVPHYHRALAADGSAWAPAYALPAQLSRAQLASHLGRPIVMARHGTHELHYLDSYVPPFNVNWIALEP